MKILIFMIPIFIFLTGIIVLVGAGYMHELAHVEIYRSYGIKSEIHLLKYFPDFVTISEQDCPTEECRLANNINESITYPLFPMFGFFILVMSILLLQFDLIIVKLYFPDYNNQKGGDN